MKYQDKGASKWLFGSTRGNLLTATGEYVFIWKLDLDANNDPREANLAMRQLDKNFMSGDSHVAGLARIEYDDNIYMVIREGSSNELRYARVNLETGEASQFLLTKNVLDKAYSIFLHNQSSA